MSVVPSRLRDLQAGRRLGRVLPVFMFALAFLLLPAGSSLFSTAESSSTVPLTHIVGVVRDDSVSIRTENFPANTDFTVTMGPMGTRGVNGYVVGTVNSGAGGSFDATYKIPAGLYGSNQISIRLQSGGYYPYYSYNWFYNNTTGTQAPETPPTESEGTPGYSGIPTFMIAAVDRNDSVTIKTNNFPASQTFNVTMGPMGTRGINGIHVGTLESGVGGELTATYPIPAELYDHTQISIRTQTAHAYPYYAYNWFWNNDANVAVADATTTESAAPSDAGAGGAPSDTTTTESTAGASTSTVYYGIPVITITGVVRDQEARFQTYNYPPNMDFSVTMGPMGTQGINGIHVGDFNSGAGGSFPVTMPIPAELAGSYQISIKAQSHHPMPYAYYSYNWFYNNTTP